MNAAPARPRPIAVRALGPLLCAALFVVPCCALLNYLGIEVDEATFATSYFRECCFYAVCFGRHRLPIMEMSYAGALKTPER